MKKVGIIGSGIVGQTLGKGFIDLGYDVMIGTREVHKLDEWVSKAKDKGKVGSVNDALRFGDILVLSVKGSAAKKVVSSFDKDLIKGKTIIDTTNPLSDDPPVNGVLKFFTSLEKSLMEELQEIQPELNFVKSFNSIGAAHMVNPKFKEKPSMFIAGNNKDSKKDVSVVLEKFGFNVEDMGGAESARAIEPLCMLWCIPGFLRNDWSHAFRLIR